MTPYKTNSADYLDYVASVKTREQIAADPRLCVFLNNPYIKDNMEIALLYNAAKTGDYVDKMAFVEYFMCNGPELDTDSLMHYRTKISLDPVCTEIAYSYYNDSDYLRQLRKSKYNKDEDDDNDNCFTNPCFYMGRFSSAVGKHATFENAASMWNSFADAFSSSASDKNSAIDALKSDATPSAPKNGSLLGGLMGGLADTTQNTVSGFLGTNNKDAIQPSRSGEPESSPMSVEKHLWGWIPSSIKNGIGAFESLCDANYKDFCIKLQNAGNFNAEQYGDPLACAFARKKEILINSNIKRQMADCARMWDHAKRFEIYNPSQNAYSPISQSQVVGSKQTNGLNLNASTSASLNDARIISAAESF